MLVALVMLAVAAAACAEEPSPTSTPPSTGATATTTSGSASSSSFSAPTTGATTDTTAGSVPSTTTPVTTSSLPELQGLEYASVAEVSFPILVTARPGDPFALAATRAGVVMVLDEAGLGDEVLDISSRTTVDGERGLLGLARHPDDDARLFLHYTDDAGDTVVSEMALEGAKADPGSERVLLTVDQPAGNHNGGMIQFGPDGALYLGLGDGGGAGDPFGNGQNPDTLLGGIVRIDVETGEAVLWHMGLRNPWRFWIDGEDVWIGDVGQNSYEEVDL